MDCAQCGATLAPGSRFCASCGATVDAGMPPGAQGMAGFAPTATAVEYAGFWIRFLAIIIDGVILGIVDTFVGVLLREDFTDTSALSFFIGLVVSAAYFTIAHSRWGQTIGKLAVGIKVVDANGGLLSPGAAFIRWIGYYVSGIILFIGYIIAAFDSRKQALHDKMAGSFVIKTPRGGGF
jgi:uncharacterized RDD family membrane protein YckC